MYNWLFEGFRCIFVVRIVLMSLVGQWPLKRFVLRYKRTSLVMLFVLLLSYHSTDLWVWRGSEESIRSPSEARNRGTRYCEKSIAITAERS